MEPSRRLFYVFVSIVGILTIIVVILFGYLFFTQPQIIPQSETFESFWIKNLTILIGALSLAGWGIAAYQNSIEQRRLRYLENYPYLQVVPFLSVDIIPLPVPKAELPSELIDFNVRYLSFVAPSQDYEESDIDFRYLGLALRNVGHGRITRFTLKGVAEVPDSTFSPIEFEIVRGFHLEPEQLLIFTLLPITGLPAYKVQLKSMEYRGHFDFTTMREFEGNDEIIGHHPFEIPEEQMETLFLDDFVNLPQGLDWTINYWAPRWGPTEYMHVPNPDKNDHYLILRGDEMTFGSHYKKMGGAYKDLVGLFSLGQTAKITVRARALPDTTAGIEIWCHDLHANQKSRRTGRITPGTEWQDISMLYTSTQTENLRVHLHYYPGEGEIQVDKVVVEGLYT